MLKSTCQAAIATLSLRLVTPVAVMEAMLPSASSPALRTTASAAAAAGAATTGPAADATAPPLASIAEAVETVGAQLRSFNEPLPALLMAVRRRLGFYLGSPVTAAILFKPVRDHMLSALAHLAAAISELRQAEAAAVMAAAPGDAGDEGLAAARVRLQRGLAGVAAAVAVGVRVVEASDQVVIDPHSVVFGYDDALVAALVARE